MVVEAQIQDPNWMDENLEKNVTGVKVGDDGE